MKKNRLLISVIFVILVTFVLIKIGALTSLESKLINYCKVGFNKIKTNFFPYLFLVSILLIVSLIFILIKLFKKIDKYKSKFKDIKMSLSENIDKYITTVASFNAVLKSLGKDEELKSNMNSFGNGESIDTILSNLDVDFTSIAKQAKVLEDDYAQIAEISGLPPDEFADRYKKLGQKLAETEKALEELKAQNGLVIPNYEVPKDTYINANILVSAGPRKDNENDTELGEDATGIVNTPKGTYFWILDGTSDSPSIKSENNENNEINHIFSSRVLAQTMNTCIRELLAKQENVDVSLKDILINAVDNTKRIMIQKIKNSSKEINLKIAEAIKKGINPYCSTTIALGFLAKNGVLKYFYLGDSEILSYRTIGNSLQPNPKDENPNPSRLFLSIVVDDNGLTFITNLYQDKLVNYSKENVDYVVAFSDGIGGSKKMILEHPQLEIDKIANTDQKTFDDKSLIVLERVRYS